MNFDDDDALAAHRIAAAQWMAEHYDPTWAEEQRRTGRFHSARMHATLAAHGVYGAGWPPEYGGSTMEPGLGEAILEALVRAGCRHDGWATTWNVANTLLVVGTEEQKQRYVAGALRGDVVIALGYTEPDSGSDVAAARMPATWTGRDWVLNGEKMFTSTADQASHVLVLARTAVGRSKHDGLTMFLVPTDAPGFGCRPIHTLGGHATTATSYLDVHVPDDARVGAVDQGWSVMRTSLVFERKGAPGKVARTGRALVDRTLASLDDAVIDAVFGSDAARERLARIAINSEVSRLLWARFHASAVANAELGLHGDGTEGAVAKLFGTESERLAVEALIDLFGARGVLRRDVNGSPLDGVIEESFRYGAVETIYGGSSEVMREIIAERKLGLPRTSRMRREGA